MLLTRKMWRKLTSFCSTSGPSYIPGIIPGYLTSRFPMAGNTEFQEAKLGRK